MLQTSLLFAYCKYRKYAINSIMNKYGVIYIIFSLPAFLFGDLAFETPVLKTEIPKHQAKCEFKFKFSNIGKSPITILSVKSLCTCTFPILKKNKYFPNETGEIIGFFDLKGKEGLQEQEITVHTDSISQSQIKLKFMVNLLEDYDLKPRLIYWRRNSTCATKEVIFKIYNPIWLLNSINYDRNKLLLKILKNNSEYIIKITPTSTSVPLKELLKIELKNKNDIIKTITLYVLIK